MLYPSISSRTSPRIRLLGTLAALLLAHGVAADTEFTSDEYLVMAQEAMQYGEYLAGAQHYLNAAKRSSDVEIAQRATRVAVGFGFDEEALEAAERWLEIAPESDQALLYVAQYQLRDGRIRESRRNFKRLLKQDDGAADQRLLSLVQWLAEEDATAAYEMVRYLAKPYKKSAYAQYAVAVMALSAEELDVAKEAAKSAAELDEKWLKPKLLYARTLLLDGQEKEAIDYTARIIGDDPDPDPDARLELALMMASMGRNGDALGQVSQILLEQPNRADALRLMAIINFREQNLDAAEQDFQDLLATRRYTSDALFYLGRIADIRGNVDDAIRYYAGVQDGSSAVFAQRRASALLAFEKEAPEDAITLLDRFAVTNAVHAVDMVLAKAQLMTSLERYDEAIVLYNRFRDFRPAHEGGMLGRADLLLRMDRLDDAIEQYRVAVKFHPDSATSVNALGYTLADRTDQYEEAEVLIRKALKYDPDNPAIIDSMGWVLYRLGDYENALVELRRAYEGFDDPEVAAHIVEVLHALGRDDEALEMLVMAEEKDPDDPLLDDVRTRLYPSDDE